MAAWSQRRAEWFELPEVPCRDRWSVSLRLNATIERGFVKQGTSISNPGSWFYKAEDGHPIIAQPANFAELHLLIDMLPDRVSLPAGPSIGIKPALPLRLVANRTKPVPHKVHPTVAAPSILPLDSLRSTCSDRKPGWALFALLAEPDSNCRCCPASDPPGQVHAMGSITAPVPEAAPELPSNLIAGGVLSAAQAETLSMPQARMPAICRSG